MGGRETLITNRQMNCIENPDASYTVKVIRCDSYLRSRNMLIGLFFSTNKKSTEFRVWLNGTVVKLSTLMTAVFWAVT